MLKVRVEHIFSCWLDQYQHLRSDEKSKHLKMKFRLLADCRIKCFLRKPFAHLTQDNGMHSTLNVLNWFNNYSWNIGIRRNQRNWYNLQINIYPELSRMERFLSHTPYFSPWILKQNLDFSIKINFKLNASCLFWWIKFNYDRKIYD